MRCIALANTLKKHEAKCIFLSRNQPGHMFDAISVHGHELRQLPRSLADSHPETNESSSIYASWLGARPEEDANQCLAHLNFFPASDGPSTVAPVDWLVLDHYAIDNHWLSVGKFLAKRVLVIDDLCDRPLQADLLLNPCPDATPSDYAYKINSGCTLMLGPEYALLRPEFRSTRLRGRKRDGHIRSILVNFGGSDINNLTGQAWEALKDSASPSMQIDLVVGKTYPFLDSLKLEISGRENVHLHIQANNMAELMENADLMLGTAGSASWERCCIGLPSILLACAENQEKIIRSLEKKGACLNLGYAHPDSAASITAGVQRCISDPSLVKLLGQNAHKLVDGLGAERVVTAMKNLS